MRTVATTQGQFDSKNFLTVHWPWHEQLGVLACQTLSVQYVTLYFKSLYEVLYIPDPNPPSGRIAKPY